MDVGHLDLAGCLALGATGPVLRATGYPWDLRRTAALLGLRRVRLRRRHLGHRRRLRPVPDPARGDVAVAAHRRAVRRPARRSWRVSRSSSRTRRSPGRRSSRSGADGMGNSLDHIRHIMGESMEALIHHFKLVTEGFRVPAGQAYGSVESPRGELACHVVSDGGTRPYRAHFRDPSFVNLQGTSVMSEGGMVADVIVAIAEPRPGHGRGGPVMTSVQPQPSAPGSGDAALPPLPEQTMAELVELAARYPQARSALLPMLHLVQSVEGYVTGRGHRGVCRGARAQPGRRLRGRDLLHDVQAPADGRVPRRRLHQHAVRGDGRRRDLRAAQGPPRRRQRRDHRGRQGHPRAHRVQRRLRLRAGDDGQLGVLRQPDARSRGRAGRRAAVGRGGPGTRGAADLHLARGRAGARRVPRRPGRRGRGRRRADAARAADRARERLDRADPGQAAELDSSGTGPGEGRADPSDSGGTAPYRRADKETRVQESAAETRDESDRTPPSHEEPAAGEEDA